MPELTIAIAKGRLQIPTMEWLAAAGFRIGKTNGSRCLTSTDESGRARFIFVKPSDVPVYTEYGIADCGVVGRDVLLEAEPDVLQPLSLAFGCCRIVVAAPHDTNECDSGMVRVATKYPRIAARHFGARGQPVEIIELSGSVELAPILGLADCIVDLVETGATLKQNGLRVIQEISQSSAQLIVNRASYQLKAKLIANLISRFKEVVRTNA